MIPALIPNVLYYAKITNKNWFDYFSFSFKTNRYRSIINTKLPLSVCWKLKLYWGIL